MTGKHLECKENVSLTGSTYELEGVGLNLDEFVPHGLNDLNKSKLMDRVDTKYLIPFDLLSTVLSQLKSTYTILEIDGKRVFTYENTYFDTDDLSFYHDHHNGRLNRYKVRHRNYVDSNKGFLEVKFKNNKGRTIKNRIESKSASVDGDVEKEFLNFQLNDRYESLRATQWGCYQRIAFADEKNGERLTLDINLKFKSNEKDELIGVDRFFIAELKQQKYDLMSPFSLIMSRMGIRPDKFSKYCMGCVLAMPGVKRNRFKPVITKIRKFH